MTVGASQEIPVNPLEKKECLNCLEMTLEICNLVKRRILFVRSHNVGMTPTHELIADILQFRALCSKRCAATLCVT